MRRQHDCGIDPNFDFCSLGLRGFITAFLSQSAAAFLKYLMFDVAFKNSFDQEKPKRQSIAARQKTAKVELTADVAGVEAARRGEVFRSLHDRTAIAKHRELPFVTGRLKPEQERVASHLAQQRQLRREVFE